MARAKALAARARADFAHKEYDLKASLAKVEEEVKVAAAKAERLRSEYEAELCLVAQQKDAASAEAEADAFVEHDGSLLSVKSEHPRDRTDKYVAGLGEFTHVREKEANSTPPSEREHDIHSACQFTPRQNRFVQSAEGDLAKFLLKKDLHLSRLAVFNEQAECFAVWKSSFISVMTELSVSPQEELDLLVKHLGFESSKYAQSIRASNAADPARGLRLLWRRLDERFGSPELVEARLRERIESFPQITKKDSRKLYDLCDLCDEINSAKDDENLGPLLKVYDTSIGTNKIVAKLPPNLKHKWTERASSYKQRHGVVFPPFTFFVEFLQNMAKVQNDPAFYFDNDNVECESIPQDMSEIPTPDVAHSHAHLQPIAASIPPLHPEIKIGLLIGRDLLMAHHVLDQILGAPSAPFAQRLPLVSEEDELGSTVFRRTKDDEKIGLSVEDNKFVAMMDKRFQKNADGRWSAPLPLRSENNAVINNREQAVRRAHALKKSLQKDPTKREHFFKFMAKILDTGATEVAPSVEDETKAWYLPLFGVYHPKKPDKIRGVFDSSATFEGVCLNDMMYSGPDLTNSLIGILLRFRQNACPMTADIEQMFYQFFVDESHRDYLRFFWHKDNDFDKPLIEYRMCVHVFGNSPSPAVAAYGLRKTVESSAKDVKKYVSDDFYIDDGVTSVPDSETAVNLMQRTKTDLLEKGGLKLHKIASSDREFLKAFDTGDLSEELQSIDLSDTSVPLPVHSCLGLMWDLNSDSFVLNPAVASGSGPFTRRGILSALNSIYDPLGFLAPATIAGKILLREISPNGKSWDEPLSEVHLKQWESWKRSLKSVDGQQVPRMYVPFSLSQTGDANFHIFCDASEKAIAAVAYVTVTTRDKCNTDIGFVMGKAKVAPSSGHTIPRLELCSAVLATEVWQTISEQLGVNPKNVTFYSDSKVVLGYINNEKRRFHTYVSNRVERIRHVSDPTQWKYVTSEMNPADVATRGSDADLSLKQNVWLQGPKELLTDHRHPEPLLSFSLISPEEDREIRPNVRKTEIDDNLSPVHVRFEKFSTWNALLNTFSRLRHICQSFRVPTDVCQGWHQCSHALDVDNKKNTETFILQTVQNDAFAAEIQCLRKGSSLSKKSPIISLSPYLDEDGLLRVGGRIHEAKETAGFPNVHPVILPKGHHVSTLLVRHYHEEVKHQGRHFTEGALRSHGLWIVGAKRLVASVIQCCFLCRRLRGKLGQQFMSNLPADRVTPTAPFSHVGVDVFGPWSVETRRTRGGVANSKRWAVVFTCLAIRAVHIEVVEDMSSSSFINALRRFVSLRGPVKEIRSDRGTNFIGAARELGLHALLKEDGPVSRHLAKVGVRWRFNPPHASHMGGAWERMIGVVRKILDSMLLDLRRRPLTHEVLCTLMAEVCAIVNSRPITAISHDPDSPSVLTPSILLTMKGEEEQIPLEMSNLNLKEMYKSQWKHVQVLSNIFWNRWKAEYLQSLQERQKWQHVETNFKEGDIVLLCDSGSHRNNWPVGLIVRAFRSNSDSLVRSAEVRIIKDNQPVTYVRPITQLVRL
ncbi:uncharacterized protein [Littorina saxatilis]|uniref:uncharacterized protein n=1 Tax=Littorina saxatilis TaxID=31220 RepID=UPI0038B68C49